MVPVEAWLISSYVTWVGILFTISPAGSLGWLGLVHYSLPGA